MRILQIVSIFVHREAYKTGTELEAETAATGRTTALTGTPTDAEKHTQAHQAIRTTPNIKLMRKTTTFLCTLALTTGAWAQQTAADDRVITSIGEPLTGVEQVTDGGVYVFHCNSANQDGYVTTATPADQDQTHVPAVEESAAVTFYLGQCMATDSRGDAEAQWFIDKDHAESVSTNDDANQTALYVNADGTNVNLQPNHWGASAWYIIKAPTLSFSIGTAGYATAQFDFAVQLPVEMTAYTATGESDNAITLETIDGGLVPAKTPVLLEAAEGDYTLNILSSGAASLDGNLLKGSLLPLTIPAEENAYILALDDNSQAAFFRVSQDGRDLARNKAYYVSTQATAESPSLALDFGKPAVGIDNAITPGTQAPETYYDLQGRRVLYPSNGIFVTADGQKVFIK